MLFYLLFVERMCTIGATMRDIMRIGIGDGTFSASEGKKHVVRHSFLEPGSKLSESVFACGPTTKGIMVHDHKPQSEDWDILVKPKPSGKYVIIDGYLLEYDPKEHGEIVKEQWLKEGDTVRNINLVEGHHAVHDHHGKAAQGRSCWYTSVEDKPATKGSTR